MKKCKTDGGWKMGDALFSFGIGHHCCGGGRGVVAAIGLVSVGHDLSSLRLYRS